MIITRYSQVTRFSIILFIIILFGLLTTQLGLAQNADNVAQLMIQANQQYEAGQYIEATASYEALVDDGVQHSNLYYNLGNAYFRQGDLGRAIVNYRRAQQLSPRDADVAANLDLARTQTIDQIVADELSLGGVIGQWVTFSEIAVLLLVFWLLLCIFICLYIMLPDRKTLWQWLMLGCVGLMLFSGLLIVSNLYSESQNPSAVVIVPEVDVIDNPDIPEEASVQFALHAGAEIQILDRRLGWRQIALPGDLRGWVPTNAIELVAE